MTKENISNNIMVETDNDNESRFERNLGLRSAENA